MSDIIRLLPDSIANQIAAGEVVQRPASVIKELLENAVDAGSTSIRVFVKDAGKGLIQVVDDGVGMSETDARMCFERHATSKISSSEDLFSIRTMGFRGEAMASIAAVAQVELKTRKHDEEIGTLLVNEGSDIKRQEPVATSPGTSISVKNLFFNVPARRNFLKSNPVEMRHIIDEFQRVALAQPEIAFALYQNDEEVYNLPAGKLSKRIVGIFGANYQTQLAPCHEDTDRVQISGYIGKPEAARKTRGEQFFFVNKRFIKSPYLNHAVLNAFEGLLPPDTYPFYVLFLEIDPKHIDINVHPTKTEIKFDDERTIYGILRAAVRQTLATANIAPSLDFNFDVNYTSMDLSGDMTVRREHPGRIEGSSSGGSSAPFHESGYQPKKSPLEERNRQHWQSLFDSDLMQRATGHSGQAEQGGEEAPLTFQSAANSVDPTADQEELADLSCFQIHRRYIASQVKSGLMLIDQEAAHERIQYEKVLRRLESGQGQSQAFLFPQTLELNPADFSLVMEIETEIRALGFDIDQFGKSAIVIKGGPADLSGQNEKALLEGLLEQYKRNQSELSLPRQENLARAMARRSGIKEGQKLSAEEMNALIDQLFACRNPNYAPGGQKTFYILKLEAITALFN